MAQKLLKLVAATDPHPRLWISIRTMPKDVGML